MIVLDVDRDIKPEQKIVFTNEWRASLIKLIEDANVGGISGIVEQKFWFENCPETLYNHLVYTCKTGYEAIDYIQDLLNNGVSDKLANVLTKMCDLARSIALKKIEFYEKMKEEKNAALKKIWLEIPNKGKLISTFADELVDVLKDKNVLFFRSDSHEIVEITKIKQKKDGEDGFTGFQNIRPHRFVTLLEEYIVPYITYRDSHGNTHEEEKSMGSDLANTLLCSPNLQDKLPLISRIFTIPVPIMHEGKLTFPKNGYDARFNSWLLSDAPKIVKEDMALEEAKEIISNLFEEFCFQSEQDKTNAIAALLTPFLRGLFTSFSVRTPVFFYIANRERAGKDYLAGITGIVYEGYALEEAPISTSENAKGNNTEEFEKIMMSAFIGGRKRMHFANNRGYINNANFEAIITNRKHSGRILGRNELAIFDNEFDFSLSGNVGVGFTPDLANRCRFVRLFLDIEDANARNFKNPNLHYWVEQNRGLILSALYALIRNWIDMGKKSGNVPFASFSEWAEVCGGVMEAAGYSSPSEPDKETSGLGGDSETSDMKLLFEICHQKYPDKYITKQEIREIILADDNNLFSYFDLNNKSDQTKFGLKIMKYVGRVLSDIRMVVENTSVRAARQKYMFTKNKQTSLSEVNGQKVVTYGNGGNVITPKELGINVGIVGVKGYQSYHRLPTEEITELTLSKLRDWAKLCGEFKFMDVLDIFGKDNEAIITQHIAELKRNGDIFEFQAGCFKAG